MEKQIIKTGKAPAPIGPYNQAVQTGNLLFISGQIAIDPAGDKLVQEDIVSETRQVMENLKAILAEGGLNFNHVIKSTIFVTDLNNFGTVNDVYGKYFSSDFPARETVEVSALPKDARVEISMIACKG
jgi:2-iminobutanoate/2-iminopropanoate deaminase